MPLKNADGILPLNLEKLGKIAVIGAFAKTPRYQGSGSSQVNPTKVSNAYDDLASMADGDGKFAYAGLSYSTFVYTGIKASAPSIKDTDGVTIEVAVKNTGNVPGKEVVQLYIHEQNPAVRRPQKELKAFNKIALAPGEQKVVTFKLSERDFAYYDTGLHDWNVRSGKFCVLVGGSSRDLPLKETIEVQTTTQFVHPKLPTRILLVLAAQRPVLFSRCSG